MYSTNQVDKKLVLRISYCIRAVIKITDSVRCSRQSPVYPSKMVFEVYDLHMSYSPVIYLSLRAKEKVNAL